VQVRILSVELSFVGGLKTLLEAVIAKLSLSDLAESFG